MTEREKRLYWLEYAKQNAKMERIAFVMMSKAIKDIRTAVVASLNTYGLDQTIANIDIIFTKLPIQDAYSRMYLEIGTRQKKWADDDVRKRFAKRKALAGDFHTKDEEDDRMRRRPNPARIPDFTPESFFNVGFFNPMWLARLRNLITSNEVGQRVASVTNTIKDKIKRSLMESSQQFVSLRKTIAKLKQDIDDPYVRSRAEVIARTETTFVSNLAQKESAEEVADEVGIQLLKVWIRTIDDRTRDTHYNAPKNPIKKDEKFLIGGKKMDKPGDPAGGVKECINCRCVVSYIPDDDFEDLLDDQGGFQQVPARSLMNSIQGY